MSAPQIIVWLKCHDHDMAHDAVGGKCGLETFNIHKNVILSPGGIFYVAIADFSVSGVLFIDTLTRYDSVATCINDYDTLYGEDICATYINGYGFNCDTYFCQRCSFAHRCDLACGFCEWPLSVLQQLKDADMGNSDVADFKNMFADTVVSLKNIAIAEQAKIHQLQSNDAIYLVIDNVTAHNISINSVTPQSTSMAASYVEVRDTSAYARLHLSIPATTLDMLIFAEVVAEDIYLDLRDVLVMEKITLDNISRMSDN